MYPVCRSAASANFAAIMTIKPPWSTWLSLSRIVAYEIIKKKKATYYGIAMGVRRICSAIIRDEKSVLPVSVYLDGEFGLSGATLSVPAIIGAKGIEKVVPISLSKEEGDALQKSAEILKETAATIGY